MRSYRLTTREADYTKKVLKKLENLDWAKPLVSRINRNGGVTEKNKPLLFEARFAYKIYQNGFEAKYEYNAGINQSTIEFCIENKYKWLIELVSITTSEAAKKAIKKTGGSLYEQSFSTNNSNKKQSEEGEMLLVEQKIGEKVFSRSQNKTTKFPMPSGNTYHVILADCRGYLDGLGGDYYDYSQIASGISGIPEDKQNYYGRYWRGVPIKGLFEKDNKLESAKYIQERIHFIGFVNEEEYKENEIEEESYYFPNPFLFKKNNPEDIFQSYPIQK